MHSVDIFALSICALSILVYTPTGLSGLSNIPYMPGKQYPCWQAIPLLHEKILR